jgi:hypothetical protein
MNDMDSKIIRVSVVVDGRRTSISLDGYLGELLIRALGGDVELGEWVSGHANRLAEIVGTGKTRRVRAGLSRLIQREAIKVVARPGLLMDARGEP